MTIRRVEIPIPRFLNGKLIKDLQENEVICEDCEGTGLAIRDNVYGLQDECGFNYKRQDISFCQHCYYGIRKKCEFCGELISRNYIDRCECEKHNQKRRNIRIDKERERFEKAEKMTYEEYIEKYPGYMFYDETGDRYHSDLEELEDQCDWDESELPKYVYGTYRQTIALDVDSIIESACDDLHEDAMDNLDGKDELRSAIDNFNLLNKNNAATYYPNYKIAIIL